jgi:hypothetical protein
MGAIHVASAIAFLKCEANASWPGVCVETMPAILSPLMVAKDLFVPTAAEAIAIMSGLQELVAQSAKQESAWCAYYRDM